MRKILLGTIALFLAIAVPVETSAVTTKTGDSVRLGSETVVEDLLFGAGGTVDLDGIYNNDVFVSGGTVTVSGTINADLFVGGGSVKVAGPVSGSIRVGGGTVDLDSTVGRNVLIFGGTAVLSDTSEVAGDVTVFSGTADFKGTIKKELNAWGGVFYVNGAVDGSVNLHTGDDCESDQCITIGPDTIIGGNLTYWAATDAEIQAGATITGKTTRNEVELIEYFNSDTLQNFMNGFRIWSLLSTLLFALLIALVLPKALRQTRETMTQRFGNSIGFGFLAFFAAPIGLILLFTTIIGIPIALILAALYFIAIYATRVFIAFWLGHLVWKWFRKNQSIDLMKRSTMIWITLLGTVLLSLVFDFLLGAGNVILLSGFGGLVQLGLMVWALGGIVMTKWQYLKDQQQ